MLKGHTCRRIHDEKDDANACLAQFWPEVKSFKNRSSRTSAPHLGHICVVTEPQAGQDSPRAITSPHGQVVWLALLRVFPDHLVAPRAFLSSVPTLR